MKIHLPHIDPEESVFCIDQGQQHQGKEGLVVVLVTARFVWLLHGDMFHVQCPKSDGNIASSSELLLNLFLVFRVSRVAQIPLLEFIKDGSAHLEDKFTDGGLANQPIDLFNISSRD